MTLSAPLLIQCPLTGEFHLHDFPILRVRIMISKMKKLSLYASSETLVAATGPKVKTPNLRARIPTESWTTLKLVLLLIFASNPRCLPVSPCDSNYLFFFRKCLPPPLPRDAEEGEEAHPTFFPTSARTVVLLNVMTTDWKSIFAFLSLYLSCIPI